MPDDQDIRYIESAFDSFIEYLKRQADYMDANPVTMTSDNVEEDRWLKLDEDDKNIPPPHLIESVYEYDGHEETTGESYGSKIEVKDYDKDHDNNRILLERRPDSKHIRIKQYTKGLRHQIYYLKSMRDDIEDTIDTPFMKLFCRMDEDVANPDSERGAIWQANETAVEMGEWHILKDGREGEEAQKEFVTKALSTPDFALLEGPPGSGKTTVLCELVMQLHKQGKKVLFCSPTHFAVDNLVEKLTTDPSIIPVRHGRASAITNPQSKKYHMGKLEDLIKKIENSKKLSGDPLITEIRGRVAKLQDDGNSVSLDTVADFIHCGTLTGIKQALRRAEMQGSFDVMIVDEASKAKLIEFMIPAQMADRWIISGDTRQLSPYTDENSLVPNLDALIPDDAVKDVCADVFKATINGGLHTVLVIESGPSEKDAMYKAQCKEHGVPFYNLYEREDTRIPSMNAGVVLCDPKAALRFLESIKVKNEKAMIKTRAKLKIRGYGLVKKDDEEWRECDVISFLNKWEESWAGIFHWRLSMDFGNRRIGGRSASSTLLPCDALMELPGHSLKRDDMTKALTQFNNVEMNSILSLLQHGYLTDGKADSYDCVLARGFKPLDLQDRRVLLTHQYRMHPDIAWFSHVNVYQKKALFTPDSVKSSREWEYRHPNGEPVYPKRLYWIPVMSRSARFNITEANLVIKELEQFIRWTTAHPKEDRFWEVGVISFYKEQQNLLEKMIRKTLANFATEKPFTTATKSNDIKKSKTLDPVDDPDDDEPMPLNREKTKEITLKYTKDDEEYGISVKWGTVDAFQGKEVDISFLSFSNHYPTMFLNNKFRINVAVTRARYQCVIFGDWRLSKRGGILKKLHAYAIRR